MNWTLRLRPDAIPANRVEARGLILALQSCATHDDASSIRLHVGRIAVPLADLAVVEPATGQEGMIRLIGDFSRWDGLGFAMKTGRLIIEGDTGARTAAELSGGTIEIHGSCGHWTGAASAGGRLVVHGDAGDWLGANWPGEPRGMIGGEIFVHGRAGSHVGVRLRRGTIAVAGSVGEGVGRGMIAGSILLGGQCGGVVGLGMKRGTIVMVLDEEGRMPISATGFPEATPFRPLTLGMQLRYAADAGWKSALAMLEATEVSRYLGDRLVQGLGEVFVLCRSTKGSTKTS